MKKSLTYSGDPLIDEGKEMGLKAHTKRFLSNGGWTAEQAPHPSDVEGKEPQTDVDVNKSVVEAES